MTQKETELLAERLQKLQKIKAQGVDPYPAKAQRTHLIGEVLGKFEDYERQKKQMKLVGRLRAMRSHGKIIFSDLEDESGKIQVAFKAEELGQKSFALLELLDTGDFLGVAGGVFKTKTGEKTLLAKDLSLLAKSLRALPEKFHGLKDMETRLRRRYLDMVVNAEVREMLRRKNVFWQTIRNFLAAEGFLEVQTPVLENVPGGADAEPFVTHHNALDRDFYLRISLELPLKRLLVGGFDRVFEIGRLFRNEGIDREHLQEYDDMEFYWAYADHEQGMALAEKMFKLVARNIAGSFKTSFAGRELNWGGDWAKVDYFTVLQKETGIDLNSHLTVDDLKKHADRMSIVYDKTFGRGRLIDAIFKKTVREKLIQPCFLVGHPLEISPLSKSDLKNPRKVLRFQILAAGTELGNGWSELNDPLDQRKRFEEQMKLRAAGDREAQMLDEDFVEALEYGMPPAVGFGMSERLFAVLMDKSIRETVIFPPMKEESAKEGKSKITKIAVAVINKGAGMKFWEELNTIAHLNAAFGAREGRKLLYQDEIGTKDGKRIKLNIQHAIMIKSANSSQIIQKLSDSAKHDGLEVSEFIKEMIATTDDKKVIERTKNKNRKDVEYLGVLVFGRKSLVESLTKDLPLYG
ncbi:MAG: lysine--tRNA ligase [Candidatus Doudnabacteria bacterium]|nr:lysine--tRNA ligase [Candidatus Doudnabacteria bacterium]